MALSPTNDDLAHQIAALRSDIENLKRQVYRTFTVSTGLKTFMSITPDPSFVYADGTPYMKMTITDGSGRAIFRTKIVSSSGVTVTQSGWELVNWAGSVVTSG